MDMVMVLARGGSAWLGASAMLRASPRTGTGAGTRVAVGARSTMDEEEEVVASF